jgi:hypothetical protein
LEGLTKKDSPGQKSLPRAQDGADFIDFADYRPMECEILMDSGFFYCKYPDCLRKILKITV